MTTPTLTSEARYRELAFASAALDDIERQRIATENRIRIATATTADSDGEIRGYGLSPLSPLVMSLQAHLDHLKDDEAKMTRAVESHVRKEHPLGPKVLAMQGVGLKQAGRLLGALGDPYINTLHDRPRTLAELWAYAGYVPGQRRQRGVQQNWSDAVKMRSFLIAESIVRQLKATCKTEDGSIAHVPDCGCSPYRRLYDHRKSHTRDRVHAEPCVRCGPSGHPAPAGSPLSDAHRHADALRYVAKRVLRDLWEESRRLHEAADTTVRAA